MLLQQDTASDIRPKRTPALRSAALQLLQKWRSEPPKDNNQATLAIAAQVVGVVYNEGVFYSITFSFTPGKLL